MMKGMILDRYFRAANYLSAAQLYLLDNPLLERPLADGDIKKKIVGHWGTVPGQNFVYTHLSNAVNKYNQDFILISGPGHGGNFFVSNAYIEGTYTEIYKDVTRDKSGLVKLFKQFSFPLGISSHVAPEVPGSMHEGGELGYSLAHAFGAVLDNPNLIAAVIVGDGEAETGPLSTSWWGNKFLNKEKDGKVLPILHLNGYKISNPTILARITKEERKKYFEGMGYEVIEIEVGKGGIFPDHKRMASAIDTAMKLFERGKNPVIILKSPKGWTSPIENTFKAHQVPLERHQIDEIEKWLRSYRPEELFNPDGSFQKDILDFCPKGDRRISANKVTFGGIRYLPLELPKVSNFAVDIQNDTLPKQDMLILSAYIAEIMKLNPNNFRFFSPDEAMSNRLYKPFEVTKRNWQEELRPTDESLSRDGRIMDSMLSEHMCEGMLEGYLLTGRHGFFATYESFARVVDSMLFQHAKWLHQTKQLKWRTPLPCLNLILTSHCWQQDHNGYTHQEPGLVSAMLNFSADIVSAYYPPDANTLLFTMEKCLQGKDKINLITASKHPSPQLFCCKEAELAVKKGYYIYKDEPTADVVLIACGDTPVKECLEAIKIVPNKRVKFIIVLDINIVATLKFNVPTIFVFHGYTNLIKALNPNFTYYLGYQEEGAITTALDMRILNGIDRFSIAELIAPELQSKMQKKKSEHKKHIGVFGIDKF
ncbi:MAG: phosphoketolase family protein [Christensenellaceae bacterium]|jgi:xylulose-5-phosphate/fructose-6-phosphate phosphoketolase|nr:phosphoketolase family protein [Christensenellaceae bacterium]